MAAKLYVGGLSQSTTPDALRAHFGQCGTVVSASIVNELDSGRSRGFGFVEMSSDTEAEGAIATLNQQPLDGKPLTVNIARSKTARTPRM
jgi:RNA recognition motif-containing protein